MGGIRSLAVSSLRCSRKVTPATPAATTTVVTPPPPSTTLVDLALSGSLTHGTTSSGTLVGAQPGSTFTTGGTLPSGLTINSSGGAYSWSGAGSGSFSFTITETNAGALAPHTSTITGSIGAGAGGGSTAGQPIGGLLLTLTKAA